MSTRRKIQIILIVLLAACTQGMAQTPDELLAIHDAHLAAMNAHDLDTMMSYWADDSIYFLVSQPPPVPKAYVQAGFGARFAARPDFRMTEGRTFAAGNVVVEESQTMYTDVATGIEVVIPHLSIYEFEGDKIKKVTSYNDRLSTMVALGQVPVPEMPPLVPSIDVPDAEPTGLSPMEADAELVARWQKHDASLVAKMCQADYSTFAGPLGMQLDRIEMTALNELYYQGFPDVQLETVRRIDLGDGWVLVELLSKGTHHGTFMDVPASGYLTGISIVWLTRYNEDGLATEQSFYYDNLTLLTQMTTVEWILDGVWITSIPTPLGNVILKCIYTAQDAEKTRYSGELEYINGLPLLMDIYPDGDESKFAGGQAVKTGRDRYKATFLEYRTKKTGLSQEEIVGMDIVNATFQIIGPDMIFGQGMGSYYMAAQDADKDGFPDEGQEPVVRLPWGWLGKRLTIMSTPLTE